tara:strand:- start:75 stop:1448 length:1374 start_codon:yes stop_codon:yes gene_type:complete
MASNLSTRTGNIRKFEIYQAKQGGGFVDASGAVTDIKYYEDILSNSISLSAIIAEVGESNSEVLGNKGMLDGLPIRGGNPAHVVIEDHDGHKLSFKDDSALYVNRVRNVIPGTQKDVYSLDFSSREFLSNEQCRVVKRYDGKISENIKKILQENTSADVGLKTQKKVNVDETAINYNFIGNDRKPFHVCTWLASKSVPVEAGKVGGTAGYLFYETYDGFNFRSIDVLNQQKSKGNYIFTNTADLPKSGEYKGKILDYTLNRDIDLQSNLSIGLYSNRTLFFDFYAYNYKVRNFDVDQSGGAASKEGAGSKGKIKTLGRDDIDSVPDEFRKPISRIMNRVLDVGSLPSGKNIDEELKTWKNTPYDPTYDATKTMVQSVMRYNQLFSIKINIMIAGDFSLRAGDVIHCEFPELTTDPNTPNNKKSGGLYMISSLCHNITPRETYTSLTLVRDTFGRKPF